MLSRIVSDRKEATSALVRGISFSNTCCSSQSFMGDEKSTAISDSFISEPKRRTPQAFSRSPADEIRPGLSRHSDLMVRIFTGWELRASMSCLDCSADIFFRYSSENGNRTATAMKYRLRLRALSPCRFQEEEATKSNKNTDLNATVSIRN